MIQHIIVSTLDSNELFKVSECEYAKEMWDTLKATHESTTKLEKSKTRRRRRKNKKGLDPYFMAKKEDEKANICLVAEGDDESCSSSDVSSCASLNVENYSELLEAFQETHDEANRLVLSNNRLKELNSWLEKRVKALEEEVEKIKK